MRQDIRSALLDGYTEPIRDALWGHIYLTPELAALTRLSLFTRLHRIMQLGPAFRIYPGATHTRASHSIGVYHLARRLLTHLADEGADAWLSPMGVKSFLCAALLHDLGHFPFTHSLKELPLTDHETLTGNLIVSEPAKSLISATGADPDFSAAIVSGPEQYPSPDGGGDELKFYRKLLSGAMDPDKLDYLSRDARYCGVPYGIQDVDFILSRLHPNRERGVDIDSRGITGVESLLFSKYLMYRSVYWHREVRSATAMVKKAILDGLTSGIIRGEDLYNLDDQGLFTFARERELPLFCLVDSIRNGQLFVPAAEITYTGEGTETNLSIGERLDMEENLAAELSRALGISLDGKSLIIDLPEPISFESGLFIADEDCFFSAGSSVFKGDLLDAFAKSLRIIRIFVDPRHKAEIKKNRGGILQITRKWLHIL